MTADHPHSISEATSADNELQETAQINAQHPWPGLAAYSESSSQFFFGRTNEANELLRMVQHAPLTILYGKSGLGKTSLLQAGFFPLLRTAHFFPIHLRLDYSPAATLAPLAQAAQKLQDALIAAQVDFTPWRSEQNLWQYLHRRDLEIWSHDNYPLTPVLVFDQFEEIFSQAAGDTDYIQANLNSLADLIENRIPKETVKNLANRNQQSPFDWLSQRYRIVLSFREDFLPEMESWKQQVPSLFRNQLRLLPMTRERAIEAVVQAGAAVLAPGVAEPLVDFVGNLDRDVGMTTSNIEPVLLSLCCYQLNRRRTTAGKIDKTLIQQAGQNILQDFYDEALRDMPEQVSEFIENHLIQGDRYRGSYPVEQAIRDGFITHKQLSLVADQYRLLRIDQQLGTQRIELIHDRLVSIVSKARDIRQRKIEDNKLRAQEKTIQRQLAFEKLNRLAYKLRIALLFTVILAGVAVYGWYSAITEREKTFLAQNSLRVVSESLDMANGTRVGGDERAILQLLAANQITPNETVDSAMLTVLSKKYATQKIWNTHHRVNNVAINHLGTHIASAHTSNTLQIWDFKGRLINEKLNAHPCTPERIANQSCGILSIAFSTDGTYIVTGGRDATVRLWKTDTLEHIAQFNGHHDYVASVAFNPDNSLIISGSADKTIRLWDVQTQATIAQLDDHKEGVTSVAFSPDGSHIISGSYDNTIRLWNTNTQKPVGEPMLGHTDSITSVSYSRDGLKIVSSSQDKTVRLWNAHTLEAIGEPLQGHDDIVWQAVFSPDSTVVVSAGHDRTLRLWKAETGKPLGRPIRGHEESVRTVRFNPDGKTIVSGSRDATLRVWNAQNHQPIHAQLKGGHKNFIASAAYSPDGKYIVSGSDDATVQLWDALTGNTIGKPMKAHTGSLNGVAFSPNGKWIVSGASDRMLCLWNAKTQQLVKTMLGHEGGIEAVAFSPDGNQIASGGKDNTVRLWDRKSGRLVNTLTGHTEMVRGVSFSPNGKLIGSAGYDDTVRLWNAQTGQPIAELTEHDAAVTSVAFSPDNGYLVSASKDHTLILWDMTTYQPLGEPFTGHTDRVNSVAFSPDGQYILSGSSDNTLRLWRKNGQTIGSPMHGHKARVNSVSFNSVGTRIVSTSNDLTLRIWPAYNNWSQLLCDRVTRNMTKEEWRTWISSDIQYRQQCPDLPTLF